MNDIPFTGERTLWWKPGDHLAEFRAITDWYMEAMVHCVDKRVLDLGSGHCFGAFLLSTVAKSLDTYDYFTTTPSDADNFPYQCGTRHHARDLELEVIREEGDIAVAIEFLEHVANPGFVLKHLKTPRLFFTIPCYGDRNPFHKVEYSEESALVLIKRYYPHVGYRMEHRRMIGLAARL
jgi:hypothetical protein